MGHNRLYLSDPYDASSFSRAVRVSCVRVSCVVGQCALCATIQSRLTPQFLLTAKDHDTLLQELYDKQKLKVSGT